VSADGGQAKLQFARDASRCRATTFCADPRISAQAPAPANDEPQVSDLYGFAERRACH
jgi:hypothetical protein